MLKFVFLTIVIFFATLGMFYFLNDMKKTIYSNYRIHGKIMVIVPLLDAADTTEYTVRSAEAAAQDMAERYAADVNVTVIDCGIGEESRRIVEKLQREYENVECYGKGDSYPL